MAVALGMSFLLAACSPGRSQTVQHVNKSVTTDASSFMVTIFAGRLVLVPGPSGQVSLRGTVTYKGTRPPTLSWRSNDTGLTLVSVCHSVNNDCSYDYTLAVPPSTGTTAVNTAGDVSVSDLSGPVSVTALAGNVVLSGLSGNLSLTDTAGDVVTTAMRAPDAHITVMSGDATLKYVAPPSHLFVRVATGDITAAVPDSASYHVVTSVQTGTNSDSIPDVPTAKRTISLSTGVGNVSLSS